MKILKKIIIFTVCILNMGLLISCVDGNDMKARSNMSNEMGIKQLEMEKSIDEVLHFSVLGKTTIEVEKSRVKDDIFGVEHLDSRWELEEIDKILDAISGTWKTDAYVGFVESSVYYPELFDKSNNLDEDTKKQLVERYNERVLEAKANVPELSFSIKECNGEETDKNYIYAEGVYPSPVSMILSLDRFSDNYPVFVDQTTISSDFTVTYPVLYIKYYIRDVESNETGSFQAATLVITSDDKFYFLKDGAFYCQNFV